MNGSCGEATAAVYTYQVRKILSPHIKNLVVL